MENKKIEKFSLLNLIRALSVNTDQTYTPNEQVIEKAPAAENKQSAAAEEKNDGSAQPNVLAEVLARHEEISNRLHRKK